MKIQVILAPFGAKLTNALEMRKNSKACQNRSLTGFSQYAILIVVLNAWSLFGLRPDPAIGT